MENSHISSLTDQAIKILEYWHKVEFFESTDIQDLEDGAEGVLQLNSKDLNQSDSLPWINSQRIRLAGKDSSPDKKYNYQLFFGIFARKEIFALAQRVLPEFHSDDISEENLHDEGRTCSVTCVVNQNGIIDKSSFKFSTVTWALGQLESGGLDKLQFKKYEQDTQELYARFNEIINDGENIKKQHNQPLSLTADEISHFLESMDCWTCFKPEQTVPLLFIKLKEVKEETKEQPPTAKTEEISILNSFYIQDIEAILTHIKSTGLDPHSPLGRYLSADCNRKADLLLPEGRDLLLEKLRLSQLPAGRWPSDIRHSMSLMQQFAINTLVQELKQSGLYSVNGPPGTGKTTMLRDLIAHNLVQRATVLAAMECATDAFDGAVIMDIAGKQVTVPCLSSDLCGYEMVVVSSNNTAVENISRELPQIKSLGKEWQNIRYWQPVAQKLAASTSVIKNPEQHNEKYYKISPLSEETDCWGLITAALGKQENRNIFKERLFFKKIDKALAPAPADNYRHLFAAIKDAQALTVNNSGNAEQILIKATEGFSKAKAAFIEAMEKYQTIIHELKDLETINNLQGIRHQLQLKTDRLHIRQLQLRAFLTKRYTHIPAWQTLRLKKIYRDKAIIRGLEHRLAAIDARYILEKTRFQQALAEQQQDRHELLKAKYPDVFFATTETNTDSEDIQRTTPGHHQALNEARSQLTVKALELHEAWLVAVAACPKTALCSVLFHLPQTIDGMVQDRQIALALWRLLFMIVPVISSTFASTARQFSIFEAGDIGWLFIDEAGQATPQQAAGALWRARRAVAVGDPLQIEPVFTIPPAFTEALARRTFGKTWRDWSPVTQSVQSLADRVNPYGTLQIAKDTWLGSPLRVHRRCDEPMFSIANAIAYNNKMLHGRDQLWPEDQSVWGNSCWFDICGEAEGKHYIPAQGQHVLTMLETWLKYNHQTLPDACIITPFKQVKNKLKAFLQKELGHVEGINQWLNKHIGTVHTFQGREEKNVILVLGLSKNNPTATSWASGRPNLLNVAVTRAQHHIYIVGSKNIWSGCQYFNTACEKLEEAVLHSAASAKQY